MKISETLHKNNPMQKKIDMENRSDFAKLVDRNTELVNEIKWLKTDNDILKGKIDKAIEQLKELKNLYDDNYTVSDKAENIINILKNGG